MAAQSRLGALLSKPRHILASRSRLTWALKSASAALALAACAPAANPVGSGLEPADDPILPAYQSSQTPGTIAREANLDTIRPMRPSTEVVRYTVQPGDSVFGIADKFGLKPETILWGNLEELDDDPHSLRPGIELNVLPVDGVYYQWNAGDDLDQVAGLFGVSAEVILDWPGNQLSPVAPQVEGGEWLVVPGGQREFQTWHVPTIPRGSAGVGTVFGAGGCEQDIEGGAVGTGGFIWPTGNHTISGNDYWSGHLALDIAAGLGEPVWAADSGVVVFAGWALGGYGNIVSIDHGNGWQTVYAHLSEASVRCGQSVDQGETIGLGGSTGNSTGPHLHFEVRSGDGFVNPWFVLP